MAFLAIVAIVLCFIVWALMPTPIKMVVSAVISVLLIYLAFKAVCLLIRVVKEIGIVTSLKIGIIIILFLAVALLFLMAPTIIVRTFLLP